MSLQVRSNAISPTAVLTELAAIFAGAILRLQARAALGADDEPENPPHRP